MRRRHLVVLALWLAVASAERSEAETPYARLYHRNAGTPEEAVRFLDSRSRTRGADGILVVLDSASFHSPAYHHEWRVFRMDGEPWLAALDAWAKRRAARAGGDRDGGSTVATGPGAGPIHVATTLSDRPVRVGESGWRERLTADLAREWWEDASFRSFEPARAWMARLLKGVTGGKRMLVLVTSEILPERMADTSYGHRPGDERWRRKLLPVGKYWDEEAIGKDLVRAGVVLDVVAPEARFCDFWPLQEIPELPWASRPRLVLPPGASEHWRRMKARNADAPAELRALIEDRCGVRFDSALPWDAYGRFGSYAFFNTHCPSGFGYWPFVRAAAATGGSYVFYPFEPVNFQDPCPYDPELLRRLAPETTRLPDILRSKSWDPALGALLRAARLVEDVTPWCDGPVRASGWSGYASVEPLRLELRYRERNKPLDKRGVVEYSPNVVERQGRQLAEVVALYDEAIAGLAEAQRGIASGELRRPHRRSMANLRLGRYWFEMSAFHLEAFSIYKREIQLHIPELEALGKWRHTIGFWVVPAIRMSDCLEGYEKHYISAKEERALRDEGPGWVGARGGKNPTVPDQSNFLLSHPDVDFRTRRDLIQVFKNLDRRLHGRALRVIRAAEDVMEHEGQSPWGWMVYYSNLHTFILSYDGNAPSGDPSNDRQKEDRDPDAPRESTPPSPGKPAGPTTGK